MLPLLLAQTGAGASALSLAVVLAVVYMAVVRFMDLNEKEPLWCMALVFALGAFAAVVLYLTVGSQTLELNAVGGPIAKELAKFVALAVGIGAIGAIGRQRGFVEMNSLLDGIVYGTTVGLGFATGAVFVQQLMAAGDTRSLLLTGTDTGQFGLLWPIALLGLSQGLFSAITGAGFGAAVGARASGRRLALPALGLAGAVLVHIGYVVLRSGNAVGGSGAVARSWLGLLIPLVFVVAVAAWALATERRVISSQLPAEVEAGVITEQEMGLLRSFGARRSTYAKTFFSGDFDGWLALKALHNRQVQLAFAKTAVAGAADETARAGLEADVERLRAVVAQLRREWELVAGPNKKRAERAGA